MNYINYRVSLDMFDTSSQITIKAKKGDSACRIIISLTKNGKIYKINEGCNAEFYGKKSDGNPVHGICDIDVEKNTIVVDFTKSIDENGVCQISAVEGIVECEVTLFKDSKRLTSPRFNLIIDGIVYNGEDFISTPDSDVLRGLINEAKSTVEEIETKLENGDFKGEKGEKGDAGVCKFVVVAELPTTDIEGDVIYLVPSDNPEEENVFNEYVYMDGAWECIGSAGVEVNLDEYVKKTDYATGSVGGVVKSSGTYGTSVNTNGTLISQIKSLNEYTKGSTALFISKGTLENIKNNYVKEGLTANTETLTEEEKAAVLNWLGVTEAIGDIEAALDSIIEMQENLIGGGSV